MLAALLQLAVLGRAERPRMRDSLCSDGGRHAAAWSRCGPPVVVMFTQNCGMGRHATNADGLLSRRAQVSAVPIMVCCAEHAYLRWASAASSTAVGCTISVPRLSKDTDHRKHADRGRITSATNQDSAFWQLHTLSPLILQGLRLPTSI